jgi:hypothetical protein
MIEEFIKIALLVHRVNTLQIVGQACKKCNPYNIEHCIL